MKALRISAPAKVNLHLAVGAVGADGYHPVTTVLQALALADEVTITPDVPFAFSCTPDFGLDPADNLAVRAARAMAAGYGRELAVRIDIAKHIPAGAGLGGASADAAAVILGLAEIWGVSRDDGGLAEVARALGADVPFFLEGGAALYTGRGDVLERRLTPLRAPVVLVKPAAAVPTPQAYDAFDRIPVVEAPGVAPLADALGRHDTQGTAALLFNAMTASSVSLVPEIADALGLIAEQPGVLGCAMAGSGSAVYGVFADDPGAAACADAARLAGFWACATATSDSGCFITYVE